MPFVKHPLSLQDAVPAMVPLNFQHPSFVEIGRHMSHWPLFTWLTFAICSGILAMELNRNAIPSKMRLTPAESCCQFNVTLLDRSFCAASLSVNPMLGPCQEVLVEMGAKQGNKIVQQGEAWRLVACMYLHGGLLHYLLNMSVLLSIGKQLERVYGFAKVGAVYMLSGVFSSIMSAVFADDIIGVGASGATMGLMGALLGELIQNWGTRTSPCRTLLQLLVWSGFELLLGTMPMIDNFAHVFGFLMGFMSSLVFLILQRVTRSGRQLPMKCHNRFVQVVAIALVPAAFVVGLGLLYGQQDARELCPWCENLSCLPFPWGCDAGVEDSCWWDCSPCSTAALSSDISWQGSKKIGTVALNCPTKGRGHARKVKNIWPIDVTYIDDAKLVRLCKNHCPLA